MPKTKQDPTGQGPARRKARIAIQNRITRAGKESIQLFNRIPRESRRETILTNATTTIYDYSITPEQLTELFNQIQRIFREEVAGTLLDQPPPDWYWREHVDPVYRQATAEEVNGFNLLIAAALVAGTLTTVTEIEIISIFLSPGYRDGLNAQYVRGLTSLRSLSDRTSAQIAQVIEAGIAAGQSPREIRRQIRERINVGRSGAARTANTEINWIYNEGRMRTGELIAEQTGLRSGVLHISALLPTTRIGHAARHGNVYTEAQQRRWWNTGSNRINCHCSIRTALIDSRGRVIDAETQEEIQAERQFFSQ